MMSDNDYIRTREMYRELAIREEAIGNEAKAEYLTGVIRGLDLAFEDGSAKKRGN
jgi:hypothetical protein